MDFRFSPKPNNAHLIRWRPWADATFAEAAEQDKPIMLSLAAVWCHWCHVMDETTFSNDEVIERANRDFVPVRVDNDRRPDINARYNMGGWPSVAFLAPDGEVLMGATYVPARRFREMMEAVQKLWQTKREDVTQELEAARERAEQLAAGGRPAGEVDESLATRALAPLFAVYDREFGGFGDGAKFPRIDILDALLARLETDAARPGQKSGPPRSGAVTGMLEQTLDAMIANELWDDTEYGFFRYTTRRDWTVPHFEKMLQDNAGLVRILARSSMVLGRPDLLEAARQAQDYLDRVLFLPDRHGYGGSQDADEDYYGLESAEERAKLPTPYVDPMVYSDWNARAVRALCALHDVAHREAAAAAASKGKQEDAALSSSGALDRATSVASMLLERRSKRGLLPHDPHPDAPDSFLDDQVALFEALLDLYEVSGARRWRAEARTLWQAIDRHFTGADAPLVADLSLEPSAIAAAAEAEARVGRLSRPGAPPQENARLAAALHRLGTIERDSALEERARAMLSALAPMVQQLGDFAAEIARAALLVLREPVHVTVVGDEQEQVTAALLEAAHGLPGLHRVVDLIDPIRDAELLLRAGISDGGSAKAYLCERTACSDPVQDPGELRRLVAAA
jgi:uncharacterized protein